MPNLAEQALAHAVSMPEGASLSAKALLRLGNRAAVDQVLVRQVFLTSGRSRKLKLGAQTVELKHAPPWLLLYPERAAGEVIRSLAWMGPAGSEAALGRLRHKLPTSELLAFANARARRPTWLASQVSRLVTRA